MWRHRIRYAFEKFLWTGKVDAGIEGVKQTVQSNLSSDSESIALPRISSDSQLNARVQLSSPTTLSSSCASNQSILSPMASHQPSSLSPSSCAVSTAASVKAPPFATPTCKLGFRLCGCPEGKSCVHKDAAGKPLPIYFDLYRQWRRFMDWRALVSTLAWVAARWLAPAGSSLRTLAAATIQLLSAPMPQLVVLYKFATAVEKRSSWWTRIIMRSVSCYVINHCASDAVHSFGHAMAQAAKQFKFPSIPPLMTMPTPPSSSMTSSSPSLPNTHDSHIEQPAPAARNLSIAIPAGNASDRSSIAVAIGPPSSIREILISVIRDTPGVTLKLLRFYSILFLIIRPLIRMKNPWRKRGQILRDLLGAVWSVSISRWALVLTSLWRTTRPESIWWIRILRALSCLPLVLFEQVCVDRIFPGNAGSGLMHAFILANAIMSAGSALLGYDVWRRACCVIDALAGSNGASAVVMGLL